MSGERVELRRIENQTDRRMSFWARKNELLEKAYHLSVLCDAEVALIIFSDRGNHFEFGSAATINKTFERYQRCVNHESQGWYQEVSKLKENYEVLKLWHRVLLGKHFGPTNMMKLDQLEQQVESSLSKARQKTQMMMEQMEDIRNMELQLGEINNELKLKLEVERGSLRSLQESCKTYTYDEGSTSQMHPFESVILEAEPSLQIGSRQDAPPKAAKEINTVEDNI